MSAINFYFHVHQPYRLREYDVFDIGKDHNYFDNYSDNSLNKIVLKKVSEKCYLPMNTLLLHLLQKHPDFAFSFSISGLVIEQLERHAPEVLESFQKLAQTGRVEFIAETFYHSLSSIYSENEFAEQVEAQVQKIRQTFNYQAKVFRNTELIYSNDIAHRVAKLGFKGMLVEGVDRYLSWRKPNFVYHAKDLPKFKLLLKNYKLSDDIAFRFSQQSWSEWPLTAEKYQNWLNHDGIVGEVLNLFMDYETFGEHQWADSGIFFFFEKLIEYVTSEGKHFFTTPTNTFKLFEAKDVFDVPELTSWADTERDLTAWRGNTMQWDSLETIYQLEDRVKATNDPQLIHDWRLLQTSDHYYYMCTKWWNDGDVHAYFSAMRSPYDGYSRFNNALADLIWRIDQKT
ncbi:polysaccharide deacetylase family protein [Candidatus Beckwithbacteria bacterium]|nr:polysaccharide deacetylase family protein [Candidatus Beckwithbacteria bacterium]